MTSKDCRGSMDVFSIGAGEIREVLLDNIKDSSEHLTLVTDAFYIIGGDVKAFIDGDERQEVYDGDLIMITRQSGEKAGQMGFENGCNRKVSIIKTTIYY
jgi:hypothetical protein